MSDLVSKAEQAIKSGLEEIEAERKSLEGALRALTGNTSGSRRRRRRATTGNARRASSTTTTAKSNSRKKGASTRKRGAGTSKSQAKAVADYLKAHPKASTAEVKEALKLKDGRIVGAQKRKLNRS